VATPTNDIEPDALDPPQRSNSSQQVFGEIVAVGGAAHLDHERSVRAAERSFEMIEHAIRDHRFVYNKMLLAFIGREHAV
jgi:hypothetical protein